ncbi:zinc finger protein 845-like [Cydia fagiglandana]|uniref:zinc finger protein 845-like n=1 Tax=Cydia fagiglandana TaxID=1458189 RepID=UPI002FEDF87F
MPLPLMLVNMDTVKLEEQQELLACRICLAWDVKLYHIRESGLDQMFSDVMGTSLSAWDGLPQHLCAWCRAQVARAQTLRARSRRADSLLKQALQHQHIITNDFIRTINRSTHKLTHTLSTQMLNEDATYYYNYDTPPDLYNTCFINHNGQINAVVGNDDINNDVKNDNIQNNSSSELDVDKLELEDDINVKLKDNISNIDANINLPEEIVERLDPQFRKVKSKKKRLSRKRHDRNSKATNKIEGIEIVETCSDKEIEKNRKRPTRRKNKEQETDKVGKRKERSKQKFCSEEDFKEFEKKYDFQVQCLTEEEMEKEMEKRRESDKYLKGEYKCELCYKGFLTSVTYENHMKTHDPARGEHACRLCHVRYQFPVKLRQHVQNTHRLKFRCARCNELVRGKACAVLHAAYHAGTTFQCAHCDKQFLKKTSRTSHMRMAHPVENAAGGTCEVCGETFTSRTGLKAHKTRSHKKVNLPELRCRKCRTQFDNMDALKRHKETYANNKCDSSLSACSQCGESCASADALILHAHEHGVQLYTCDTCGESCASADALILHAREHGVQLYTCDTRSQCGESCASADALILHAHEHGVQLYTCDTCGESCASADALILHAREHGVQLYTCDTRSQCGESCASADALILHAREHGVQLYTCDTRSQCGESCASADALILHAHEHGVQLYTCDTRSQCGESCASADALILHAHEHGVQLYTCDTCTKSFTSKPSLATHIDRVHRLLRPPKADYSDGGRRSQPDWLHWASVCEHCGKRLSCLATLKIHMNKHTGERPYKCSLCPKAYMTPYGLNNHQAFHTGVRKWQCPECPATFMHQSSVYQHRKIHTGERSHQCTICEKYFTQSGSLYTHVKYVHKKETPPPRKRNKKPVL